MGELERGRREGDDCGCERYRRPHSGSKEEPGQISQGAAAVGGLIAFLLPLRLTIELL